MHGVGRLASTAFAGALAALAGCATAHHNYSLDLSQIPEGLNCFDRAPSRAVELCQWRLRSGLEDLLQETLDGELHDVTRGYRARFELVDLDYASVRVLGAPVRTRVAYRFTLRDANDRELVALDETLIQPTLGRHHSRRRYFSTLNAFFFETFAPVIERIRVAVAQKVGGSG